MESTMGPIDTLICGAHPTHARTFITLCLCPLSRGACVSYSLPHPLLCCYIFFGSCDESESWSNGSVSRRYPICVCSVALPSLHRHTTVVWWLQAVSPIYSVCCWHPILATVCVCRLFATSSPLHHSSLPLCPLSTTTTTAVAAFVVLLFQMSRSLFCCIYFLFLVRMVDSSTSTRALPVIAFPNQESNETLKEWTVPSSQMCVTILGGAHCLNDPQHTTIVAVGVGGGGGDDGGVDGPCHCSSPPHPLPLGSMTLPFVRVRTESLIQHPLHADPHTHHLLLADRERVPFGYVLLFIFSPSNGEPKSVALWCCLFNHSKWIRSLHTSTPSIWLRSTTTTIKVAHHDHHHHGDVGCDDEDNDGGGDTFALLHYCTATL